MRSEQLHVFPPLNTAVLFLVFNRPDTTSVVFEAIRLAKPPRLYVAIDGPRANREGEAEKVEQVRKIATAVDWPCEVRTLIRKSNLGCKKAVSSAIDWFFENEAEGIVLEDDCLPHPDFFGFCETLLARYANDERVCVVTGDNFQNGIKRGEASYYFSRYNHVWGWASWRSAWQKRDMEISFWPQWKKTVSWQRFFTDAVTRRYWEKVFDRIYRGEVDTWDYPWVASCWFRGGLVATPNVNLVSNIGFGADSTHTKSVDSPLSGMATETIGEIRHPSMVEQDVIADGYLFDHHYDGKRQRFPYSLLKLPKKALSFTRSLLKWNVV